VDLVFGSEDDYNCTSYHKQIDANCLLVTQGSNGRIGLVDRREDNKEKCSRYFQVFAKHSAKTVDVHPLRKEQFLCPSNGAGCGIFDMRSDGGESGRGVMKPLLDLKGWSKFHG
jgi:hypothetical protein